MHEAPPEAAGVNWKRHSQHRLRLAAFDSCDRAKWQSPHGQQWGARVATRFFQHGHTRPASDRLLLATLVVRL